MSNPWLGRRILNYAHQGGALEAPSSTLFALRHALSAGATALELDVHRTRDGELVVCHDTTVDRTTNGSGAIADLTLAELRKLDNAYHFTPLEPASAGFPYRGRAPTDPEFRIATVREVLEQFPRTFLNFDLKAGPEIVACAESLAALLRAFRRSDDVIVASFEDEATAAFGQVAPEFATSVGTQAAMEIWQAVRDDVPLPHTRCLALQLPAEFQGVPVVDSRLVERAHQAELAVHVWTVNDAPLMERMIDAGVDGIISDRPSLVAEVLRRRGGAYVPQR